MIPRTFYLSSRTVEGAKHSAVFSQPLQDVYSLSQFLRALSPNLSVSFEDRLFQSNRMYGVVVDSIVSSFNAFFRGVIIITKFLDIVLLTQARW